MSASSTGVARSPPPSPGQCKPCLRAGPAWSTAARCVVFVGNTEGVSNDCAGDTGVSGDRQSHAGPDHLSGEAQSSCCRALSVPSPAARSLAHCISTERASVTSVRACAGDSGSTEVLDAVVCAGAIRELDVCALDLEVYVRRRRSKTPVKAASSLKQLPNNAVRRLFWPFASCGLASTLASRQRWSLGYVG